EAVRQLGPDDAGAAEVVGARVALLADDHDLVAQPAPGPRERPRVDVRARAAEQVPVPEDALHGRRLLVRARGGTARVENRGLSPRSVARGRACTNSCPSSA